MSGRRRLTERVSGRLGRCGASYPACAWMRRRAGHLPHRVGKFREHIWGLCVSGRSVSSPWLRALVWHGHPGAGRRARRLPAPDPRRAHRQRWRHLGKGRHIDRLELQRRTTRTPPRPLPRAHQGLGWRLCLACSAPCSFAEDGVLHHDRRLSEAEPQSVRSVFA